MGPLNHQCVHHVYHCAFLISSLRSPHSSCRPRSSRSLAVSTKTFTTFFASFREDVNVKFINTPNTLTTSSNRFKLNDFSDIHFVLTTSTRHASSPTNRHASSSTRLASSSTTPPSFSLTTSTSHEHVKGWRIYEILVAKMNPHGPTQRQQELAHTTRQQQLAHTARQQQLAHIAATRARQLFSHTLGTPS